MNDVANSNQNVNNNNLSEVPMENVQRHVQVLLVKNEKEHAWAINSRNID